jgi:hypothetical protein
VPTPDAELRSNIKLILSQVMKSVVIYTYPGSGKEAVLQHRAQSGEIVIAPPGLVELSNQQVVLLVRLYSACGSPLQESFPTVLLSEMTLQTASVIVQVLLQTGHLRHLEKFLADSKQLAADVRFRVWDTIREALKMEAHRFSEEDLSKLEAMRAAELRRIPRGRPSKHPGVRS